MAEPVERVLTHRELNRALLERQFLLERKRTALPRALERIGGIQAQYAPSMYIGLWSRLAGFERERLTRALERRTVIQGTLLRSTIHLVSARDYWPIAIAVRRARREWWLRTHSEGARDIAAAAARMRRRLAHGPLSRAELIESPGTSVLGGAGLWLDMVRVPPSGTWERRRADLYAAAENWVGPPAEFTQDEAIDLLVTRYLGGFGPARPTEIADWAGLPVRAISPALARRTLRRFRDEQGRPLVDLPGGAAARPGHTGARALSPHLGRHAAGPTRAGQGSCRRTTDRSSSARRTRSRWARSPSTGPWQAPGDTRVAASTCRRSRACPGLCGASSKRRERGLLPFTRRRRCRQSAGKAVDAGTGRRQAVSVSQARTGSYRAVTSPCNRVAGWAVEPAWASWSAARTRPAR
jgi:hypothetical protein